MSTFQNPFCFPLLVILFLWVLIAVGFYRTRPRLTFWMLVLPPAFMVLFVMTVLFVP